MGGSDNVVRKPEKTTCEDYIVHEDDVNFRRYRGEYKPEGYVKGETNPYKYPSKRPTPKMRDC